MRKTCYNFLFTVVCAVSVSCTPHNTSVNISRPENPDTQELHDNQYDCEQDQDCSMTVHEKQRILLLEQDYQGALNLMPQIEKELLAEGMLGGIPLIETLRGIRHRYCYLYMAMGRDAEALHKVMEIELPIDPDPISAFADWRVKILVLERLNRVDEIIDDINAFLNVPNADSHGYYPEVLLGLIYTQIVKGDFESAQNSISQYRNSLQGLLTHVSGIQQYDPMYTEDLSLAEYYINNLTETHTARFVKGELMPPARNPDNPNTLFLLLPGNRFEIVSKTDGSLFTLDDFREIFAEQLLHNPFPTIQDFPELQDNVPVLSPWEE